MKHTGRIGLTTPTNFKYKKGKKLTSKGKWNSTGKLHALSKCFRTLGMNKANVELLQAKRNMAKNITTKLQSRSLSIIESGTLASKLSAINKVDTPNSAYASEILKTHLYDEIDAVCNEVYQEGMDFHTKKLEHLSIHDTKKSQAGAIDSLPGLRLISKDKFNKVTKSSIYTKVLENIVRNSENQDTLLAIKHALQQPELNDTLSSHDRVKLKSALKTKARRNFKTFLRTLDTSKVGTNIETAEKLERQLHELKKQADILRAIAPKSLSSTSKFKLASGQEKKMSIRKALFEQVKSCHFKFIHELSSIDLVDQIKADAENKPNLKIQHINNHVLEPLLKSTCRDYKRSKQELINFTAMPMAIINAVENWDVLFNQDFDKIELYTEKLTNLVDTKTRIAKQDNDDINDTMTNLQISLQNISNNIVFQSEKLSHSVPLQKIRQVVNDWKLSISIFRFGDYLNDFKIMQKTRETLAIPQLTATADNNDK